jgi:hypothetical protein
MLWVAPLGFSGWILPLLLAVLLFWSVRSGRRRHGKVGAARQRRPDADGLGVTEGRAVPPN